MADGSTDRKLVSNKLICTKHVQLIQSSFIMPFESKLFLINYLINLYLDFSTAENLLQNTISQKGGQGGTSETHLFGEA